MEILGILFIIIVLAFRFADLLSSDPFGGMIKWIMRKLGLYGDEKYQEEDDHFTGSYAVVSRPFQQIGDSFQGHVKLNGVEWKALCRSSQLSEGTPVIVKNMSNLTLEVEPR
ncbi:MAG: NfeD family protein [Candidatus Electrothrix scaldis]|nr:MAG: NfeD family protein [Candidatus Electrothrix sp. GW3-3]